MGRVKVFVSSAGLFLALTGCCGPPVDMRCENHRELPFPTGRDTAGPPLVLATADFDAAGHVLIKLQVEDSDAIDGNEAEITFWSGQGAVPTGTTTPPPGGFEVYTSGGIVPLRHWTTHLDRSYDPSIDSYWLYARVDHATGGPPDVRYLVWTWVPSTTPDPDTPHEFNEL